MVILGALVSVPIMFVNVLNDVAASILVRGSGFLSVFEQPQLDALAYLFLRLHGDGITVTSVFWGLWLFPFGMLVIRSGFIPRVLGVLLLVAGASHLVTSTATLIFPPLAPPASRLASPFTVAELPIIVWLVVRGARPQPATPPAH
jgi:hypothetical protein